MQQFGVIQPLHYSHTVPPRMTSRKAVGEPDTAWVIYWGRGRLGGSAGSDWRRFGDEHTTSTTPALVLFQLVGVSLQYIC